MFMFSLDCLIRRGESAMNQRTFNHILLLALMLILASCFCAFAEDDSGYFSYAAQSTSSDGVPLSACITGIRNDAVTVTVPQTAPVAYKDKDNEDRIAYVPVVKISKEAFYSKTNLESITFTEEVDVDFTGMFSGCTSLKNVDLAPFELETIPTRMFYNCPALETVTVAPTYTVIGEKAFYGDGALQSFSIPEGVTLIDNSAFCNCSSVKITFSASNMLEDIRYDAFNGCAAMEGVILTDSLTKIGDRAFANCTSLDELRIPGTISSYGRGIINGCTGLKTLAFGGSACPVLNNYEWFQINNASGMVNQLGTIIIGEGVTEIGKNMFYNEVASGRTQYQALTTVVLPSTLTTIGENAFRAIHTLTDIQFPAGLTYIGVCAFDNCEALKPVFPANNRLQTIDRSAFDHCAAMESVTLNSTLRTLGNRAFAYCTSLTELSIPAEVESYNTHMIRGCTSLKTLTLGGSAIPVLNNYEWFQINYDSGSEDHLETIIIREGVTEIGRNMFYNDALSGRKMFHALTTVNLPETLTTIGENAFKGITTLTNIEFPEGLTYIGVNAFCECSSLKPVFPENNALQTIDRDAFNKCSAMENVTLTSALTTLGDRAFAYCTSLTELVLPASVETYGTELIRGCTALTRLEYGGAACPAPASHEIFAIRGTSNALKTIVVHDGVTTIADDMFNNVRFSNEQQYPSLTTIVLPETVTTIGKNAFRALTALTEINFPSKVTVIREHTFDGLASLEHIALPATITTIENSAFLNCSKLKIGLSRGNTIVSIGYDAFRNCAAMDKISFGDAINSIDSNAFAGCTSLTDVYSRKDISEIKIYGGNDYLKEAVWHYRQPTPMVLPAAISVIEASAFESIAGDQVIIPAGITAIKSCAFANNPQLEEIIFTDDSQLTNIAVDAFAGCTDLTIIAPADGPAQAYANANGIAFKVAD